MDLRDFSDDTYDLVLELGPIYHLETVKERLAGIFGNEFVVGVNITPLYQ